MRTLLTQRVDEGLRNQFGTRTVQEVVSGERDELMNILTTDLNTVAAGELGIEVLDVRVKKIELPTEVNESVYNRMRTEERDLPKNFVHKAQKLQKVFEQMQIVKEQLFLLKLINKQKNLEEMVMPKLLVSGRCL